MTINEILDTHMIEVYDLKEKDTLLVVCKECFVIDESGTEHLNRIIAENGLPNKFRDL